MKNITAVIGDYYHDEALYNESLTTALKPLIDTDEVSLNVVKAMDLSRVLPSKPELLIIAVEDRVDPEGDPELKWMTSEMSDQLVSYVEQGGSLLAWHSGLASYDPEGSYVRMLRGYFVMHPDVNKPVKYEGEHIAPFEFMDEHYFVQCDEENTHVFLRSVSEDGNSIAGWHHSIGTGRVSCLTPAHRREGLLDQSFIQLLRQTVRDLL